MSVVFSDTFTVGSDTNIEAYPATPDYSLMNGSAGHVVVNAANDRVQCTVAEASARRARCINAAVPTGDQQMTATGLFDNTGNRSQPGVLVRCAAATDDCYLGRIRTSDANVEILRVDAGTATALANASRGLGDGTHTLRLKVTGAGATVSLEFQVDATAVLTFDDTNASRKISGTPGLQLLNDVANDAWLDDLSVDDLAVGLSPGPMFRGA